MADYNTLYQQGLYLTPDQQDLLLAAFSTANPSQKPQSTSQQKVDSSNDPNHTPGQTSSGSFSVSPSGRMDGSGNQSSTFGYEDSPFLDFNPDVDLDFLDNDNLIGDLPPSLPTGEDYEPGDKRKDMDGPDNDKEESGKKRRESDEKAAKKPGRKPLTSEPTSKRKAQNRAAQRAFRERKEKHLKDLELKVEELQKASDNATQENGLLRAHVERLQVELKEYRKRLSWVTTGNGLSPINAIPAAHSRGVYGGVNNNDFLFDFPKFGDLPGSHIFNGQSRNSPQNISGENQSAQPRHEAPVPGVLTRNVLSSPTTNGTPSANSSNAQSPASQAHTKSTAATSVGTNELNGISMGYTSKVNSAYNSKQASHDTPSSDSPSSSSDSHHSQLISSSGTSPEPSTHSPAVKATEGGDNHTCTYSSAGGEESFCAQLGMACGNINNPIPAVRHNSESATNTPAHANNPSQDQLLGLDLLAQQNGGQFDPVLFGDWREPQDAILSQDFGTFFDDAFPLPDLGSPSHNLTEVAKQPVAPKKDLISEIDRRLEDDEEVVPGEDKSQMLTCAKIWDRLQSMEKFRNGEIDVDNLCSELRTKARCSEGGVVVNQQDVDDIMGRVK